MDAKAQTKALLRSRLRETSQKREKRIDSPLVRYNEDDQPVCRVCSVILKSESLWSAHQASRKHHEAIENIKAAAARQTAPDNLHLSKQQNLQDRHIAIPLPDNLLDSPDAKKRKIEQNNNISGSGPNYSPLSEEVDQSTMAGNVVPSSERMDHNDVMKAKEVLPEIFSYKGQDEDQNSHQSKVPKDKKNLEVKQARGFLPSGFFDRFVSDGDDQSKELSQQSEITDGAQLEQVKGALPAGFFDNKDADLRARGIEPVKVHIDDAYKEFEKEIQDDLQEVDDRLEDEEIDAGEVREQIESHEQKAYRERVEMLKLQLIEAKKARLAKLRKSSEFGRKDSSDDSSEDGDADEDFSVDWRAKRL